MIEKTKVCTQCNTEKLLSRFHRQKTGRFGVNSVCKLCRKEWGETNKNKIKIYAKAYCKVNRGKLRAYSKAYCETNRDKLRVRGRAYYNANKDKARAYRKANKEKKEAYLKANKNKISAQHKIYHEGNKEKRNAFLKEKRKTDLKFKLNGNISEAIRKSLKGNKKGVHWEGLVGYTIEKLKKYLERQFVNGMSWLNYGKWHIDHKIPISVFNFTDPKHSDFKRCWALKNLQPLWAHDNSVKHNKITNHFQPSLLI